MGTRQGQQVDARSSLWNLRGLLTRPFPFFLGFAFVEAWSQTLFSGRFASALPSAAGPVEVVHVFSTVVAILVAVCMALLASRFQPFHARREALYAVASLGAVASVGMLALGQGFGEAWWFMVLNSVVSGCSIWLLICWYEGLATQGALGAVAMLGVCAIVSGLIYAVVMALPGPAAMGTVVVLPLAAAFTLGGSTPSRSKKTAKRSSIRLLVGETRFTIMLIAGFASFFSGIVGTLDLGLDGSSVAAPSLSLDVAARIVVMVVAILIAVFALRRGIVVGLCLSVAFMMVSAMMMAFAIHPFANAATSMARIGSEAAFFIVFGALIRRDERCDDRLSFSLAMLVAFRFGGTLLGQLVVVGLSGNHTYLGILLLSDLVIMVMLVMAARPWLAPPASVLAEGSKRALVNFATRHQLSPRECDVLSYWIGGHTSAHIEEELRISKHTVKTHIKSIYAKTGASSKEELIVLFETETKSS